MSMPIKSICWMAFFFLLLSRHYKVICLLISKAIFFSFKIFDVFVWLSCRRFPDSEQSKQIRRCLLVHKYRLVPNIVRHMFSRQSSKMLQYWFSWTQMLVFVRVCFAVLSDSILIRDVVCKFASKPK